MLREIRNVKGIPGQGVRRWFNDARLDLFVWYDADGSIIGFQLCFDKDTCTECALTFTEDRGYSFDQVTGESSVCDIGSPVLSRAGGFSRPRLIAQLSEQGEALERSLYDYLRMKPEECPQLSPGEATEVTSQS